jgi:hypothetical protein
LKLGVGLGLAVEVLVQVLRIEERMKVFVERWWKEGR